MQRRLEKWSSGFDDYQWATTLAKGDSSEIVDAGRLIVRDQAAWRALWSAHAGRNAQPPDVDFTTRIVAAAFAGERPTPGYVTRDCRHAKEGSSLAIIVAEAQPPRGMIAAQMIVTPFHIVSLPRYDGDVRFIDASGLPFRGDATAPASSAGAPNATAVDRAFTRAAAEAATPSTTGLEPNFAAALAYLAGPFSGVLILLVERANGFVSFHAWQAILGLGGLGLLSAGDVDLSRSHTTAVAVRFHGDVSALGVDRDRVGGGVGRVPDQGVRRLEVAHAGRGPLRRAARDAAPVTC